MSGHTTWRRTASAALLLLTVCVAVGVHYRERISPKGGTFARSGSENDTLKSQSTQEPPGQPLFSEFSARAQGAPRSPQLRSLREAKLGQIEPLSGDFAVLIPDLERRAKSSDTKAAVDLWYSLDRCKAALSESEATYIRSGVAPNPEAYAKAEEGTLDSCKSVTAEQIAHRYDWLRNAAAEGDPQAQFFYAAAGSAVFGTPNDALRDPQKWEEYRNTATSYLDSLAQRCDPSAISYLWWGYKHGDQYFSADATKALFYTQIYLLMNPSENSPAILAMAREGLPESVIDSQYKAAGYFYENHCN